MKFSKLKFGNMFKKKPVLKRGYLSENFKESEFACKGKGTLPAQGIDPKLLALLEDIRTHFGAPIKINSGYRSPEHNAKVGGAKGSYHVKGMAADIVVRGVPAKVVYNYLAGMHTGGVGKYSRFTHVDVRDGKARWEG
jgi:uncharacterized protein YcbK (DUF882 family)